MPLPRWPLYWRQKKHRFHFAPLYQNSSGGNIVQWIHFPDLRVDSSNCAIGGSDLEEGGRPILMVDRSSSLFLG